MTPRRVAFFDAYPHEWGGAHAVTVGLASAVAHEGWQPLFVTTGEGPVLDRADAAGIDCRVVAAPDALSRYSGSTSYIRAAPALPGFLGSLRRALADVRVVHANDLRAGLLAAAARRRGDPALVWHVHAHVSSRALAWFVARRAAATVCVSRALRDDLARRARIRCDVIANPPGERARDRTWTPTRSPVVATVARRHPDKGVDVLLEAMTRLRSQFPEARLEVIGAEPPDNQPDAGSAGPVDWQGWLDDPTPRMASASVYVQPSRREGWSLATADALAMGVPVVASAVGGLPELVDGAGVLVPAGEPEALAAAIGSVLSDQGLADRLSRAGRERAAQLGTTADAASRWARLYCSVS